MRQPTDPDNYPRARTDIALDRATLSVATLASVLGAMITSAIGSGFLASLLAAVLVPAVTTFLVHPGPHRRRRVMAVLTLVALLRGGREAVASERLRHTSAPLETRRPGVAPAFSAAAACVFAVLALTLVELLLGHAALADRRLTLLPDDAAASVAAAEGRSGPALVVPKHRVVTANPDAKGARVRYSVEATDADGAHLEPQCVPASGSRFRLGDTVVRCTAVDGQGDKAAANFTITVRRGNASAPDGSDRPPPTGIAGRGGEAPSDRTAPRLFVPSGVTVDARARRGSVVTYSVSAVDNNDGLVIARCDPASGSLFPVGRTVVRCSARDGAGNTAGDRFVVRVRPLPDIVPPRLELPARVARATTDPSGMVLDYAPVAIDDRDGVVAVDCSPPSGSHFAVGRTIVRCTAADRAGNVARGDFVVRIRALRADGTPPRLRVPDLIARVMNDRAGIVIDYRATAVDDRDGAVGVSCTPASGSRFGVGTTRVRCTANDDAGNTASDSFIVRVELDTVPPRLELPDGIDGEARDAGETAVEYAATAIDNRDGVVPVECTPPSGSVFAVGRTIVRCFATDRAGNVGRGRFIVRVRRIDRDPPQLALPENITSTTTDSSGTIVRYAASAVDARDGAVPIECSPRSGDTFPVGTTTVRCTATDRAGNVGSGQFTVNVELVEPRLH